MPYLHIVRSEKMLKLLLEYGATDNYSVRGVFASVWNSLYYDNP